MNDYLHSIRKPLKASADHTRYASCCYLGGLPRVWASVLSMGKLSVCAVKIDVAGLGLYHFILLLLSQYRNVYLSPPFSGE